MRYLHLVSWLTEEEICSTFLICDYSDGLYNEKGHRRVYITARTSVVKT